MYSITVRNNILIAHTLPGEVFGPAQNMHGATYIVDAEFFAKELNEFNIIMDLGVVTEILADVLKFYSYKNLDEIAEFNNIITTTEFLAKDIFNKITDKLKKDYSNDFKKLHKIKIILTESNLAWATYEDEIKNNL
ncbi:MAG: 6-carboxytetrahydropterin synthase [Alphaproteobacteria bacterium]|jgi:6-pyruvoyltetrahydropterin/6-carboxytetrahydropterin synthase|nr:6-carboxytetrahydropterin synthase [Alphaproteobacteria bacterium]MDG2007013.1 6-carboxytetrahydropterin synthase [Alphaproteobacteria bacterium]|tara:strand:- start:112 stop:519 length:408 start_codon:yes stop_codon:yes gene_type:complete